MAAARVLLPAAATWRGSHYAGICASGEVRFGSTFMTHVSVSRLNQRSKLQPVVTATPANGRPLLPIYAKKKEREKGGGEEEEEGAISVKTSKQKGKEGGPNNENVISEAFAALNGKNVESEKSGKEQKSSKHGHDHDGNVAHFLKPNFGEIQATAHYPDSLEAHAGVKEHPKKKKDYSYSKELERLQLELVKLQEWIVTKGLKVVVIFEGRDAAGKGGIIKTITEPLNPRVCSVHALSKPSDREKTQWYFQRYIAHLPAAGEMVIFDRSWYNRAGVEKVMGFCTEEEYKEFLRSCPEFERMLVRSGVHLIKYWISVSPEEQLKRFEERLSKPEKRWKLSTMDLYSRAKWSEYSYAKDVMFSCTDIKQAPWNVVPADNKKAARLNCMSHLLSQFPYEDLIVPNDISIPPLQEENYVRPPITDQSFVPVLF